MKTGDLVLVKLTGDIAMTLEELPQQRETGYVTGWKIRLPDMRVIRVFDFEITPRPEAKATPSQSPPPPPPNEPI